MGRACSTIWESAQNSWTRYLPKDLGTSGWGNNKTDRGEADCEDVKWHQDTL